MKHVIQKQILDISTNTTEEAFELQQRVNDFFYSSILPVLEASFDQLSNDQQVFQLDKLEIDLGRFSMKDIQREAWSQLVLIKLRRELNDHLRLFGKKSPSVERAVSASAQWIYYMKTGHLAWNTVRSTREWFTSVLEGFASDSKAVEELKKLILENPVALRRITLLHAAEWLTHIVEIITASRQQLIPALIEMLEHMPSDQASKESSSSNRETMRMFWQRILTKVAAIPAIPSEELIDQCVLQHLPKPGLKNMLQVKHPSQVKTILTPLIQRALKASKQTVILPVEDNKNPIHLKEQETLIPEDGIYVGSAGLVLLHPFLQRCFTYTGFWNGAAFTSVESHQKAVLLLHWMTAGEHLAQEHELVVHKVLCGYPIHEPIDTAIKLQEEEMKIAGDLLDAVISSWSILKNTSREGLQQQFILRNGKLINKNQEWKLQVESNTVDILLDHLPWTISRIRLPWMARWLKVEWR